MLASLMAASSIEPQTVNLIRLFVLWKTSEQIRSFQTPLSSQGSLPSTKHETRERPLEESKITFELISPLKSQGEDFCLLGLASHHSATVAFYVACCLNRASTETLPCKSLLFVWRDKVCLDFLNHFHLQSVLLLA